VLQDPEEALVPVVFQVPVRMWRNLRLRRPAKGEEVEVVSVGVAPLPMAPPVPPCRSVVAVAIADRIWRGTKP